VTVSQWRGWHTPSPRHDWHDLSRVLDSDVERVPSFPAPTVRNYLSMPADPLNVTELRMVVHVGTHLDAPVHFIPDGPAVEEIPLDRLAGPGVVWRVDAEPFGIIDAAELQAADPPLRAGGMVLLDTGWAARWGTPSYHDNPSLSLAAARWLVQAGAVLLGVDFATPDLAPARRPGDFDWPVHQVLLRSGVLVVEHLCGLTPLAGQRVEVVVGALPVRASDGAPARILARPLPTAPHELSVDAATAAPRPHPSEAPRPPEMGQASSP
jgi:kynurenine formamidase